MVIRWEHVEGNVRKARQTAEKIIEIKTSFIRKDILSQALLQYLLHLFTFFFIDSNGQVPWYALSTT